MTNEENNSETTKNNEEKPFYKTGKGIAAIVIVCCVGVLIIALVGGMLAPDKTTTTTSTSTSNDNSANDGGVSDETSSYSGYQVRITYDGSWSGAIGSTDSTTSYDGSGSETIDLGEVSYDIVSAVIQKMDGGSGELKVEILKDGEVVKEGSTTADYGVVSIASS